MSCCCDSHLSKRLASLRPDLTFALASTHDAEVSATPLSRPVISSEYRPSFLMPVGIQVRTGSSERYYGKETFAGYQQIPLEWEHVSILTFPRHALPQEPIMGRPRTPITPFDMVNNPDGGGAAIRLPAEILVRPPALDRKKCRTSKSFGPAKSRYSMGVTFGKQCFLGECFHGVCCWWKMTIPRLSHLR